MNSTAPHAHRPGAMPLRDMLARRGADRIALFHTDHFEPWERRGHVSLQEWRSRGAEKVHRFAERMAALPHGRRLGLHYLPELEIERARSGSLRVEGDVIGIAPRTPEDDAQAATLFAGLPAGVDFDLQVHFHHERLTRNRRSASGPFAEAFTADDPALQRRRFDLGLAEALRRIRNDTGRPLDRWLFVHGLWALNASDPDVCSITDEIARLMAAGCLGDFTFPAGRTHCDPSFDQPALVRPVDAEKGYARAEADPQRPGGAKAGPGRFFVWSSRTAHSDASLDFGSPDVAANFANVAPWAERLLAGAVQRGRTLYIKTHAHSLFPFYFEPESGDADGLFPHEHDGVRRLVDLLAEAAGGALDFLHPSEVFAAFTGTAPDESYGYGDARLTFPRAPVERVDAAARLVLRDRLETLGEGPGGLGAHYRELLERGRIVQAHEPLLLDLLVRLVPPDMPIVHLRSGAGVLPLALALAGRTVVSIEPSATRHAAQAAIEAHLAGAEPALADRFTLLRLAPGAIEPRLLEGACLLIPDLEMTLKPGEEAHVRALLTTPEMVLLDAGRFGVRRRGAEVEAFAASLHGRGGAPAVCALDLGEAMQLYALDNRGRAGGDRRERGPVRRWLGAHWRGGAKGG